MTFGSTKCRKLLLNIITQVICANQKTVNCCISLTTSTCNVWNNMLSRICKIIGCQFKCSVDTLIITHHRKQHRSYKRRGHQLPSMNTRGLTSVPPGWPVRWRGLPSGTQTETCGRSSARTRDPTRHSQASDRRAARAAHTACWGN